MFFIHKSWKTWSWRLSLPQKTPFKNLISKLRICQEQQLLTKQPTNPLLQYEHVMGSKFLPNCNQETGMKLNIKFLVAKLQTACLFMGVQEGLMEVNIQFIKLVK